MRRVNATLVLVLALCLALPASAAESGRMEIANGHVRVVVTKAGVGWHERFDTRAPAGWRTMLAAGHEAEPDPAITIDGGHRDAAYTEVMRGTPVRDAQEITLTARAPGLTIHKRIVLRGEDRWAHVTVTATVMGRVAMGRLLSSYTALPEMKGSRRPEFVFTPVLRPDEHDVIGDHVFRSPAIVMQQGPSFVAVVPDPDLMDTPRPRIRTAADVRVDSVAAPLIAYGLMPWTVRGHVLYRHTDSMSVTLTDTTVTFGYFVLGTTEAAPREGYREVVHFLWERFGRRGFMAPGGPQHEPFAAYIRKAWDEYLPSVAMDATVDGKPVTLLRQGRLAWSNGLPKQADNDCWFNVWFNALRTAYGMAFYGDRVGRRDLVRQAEGVLTLALSAPHQGGIAPSIFYVDTTGTGHWVGDHAWGGIGKGEYLPMFHNAWTGVWLLRWAELRPERRNEILAYTGRLARFLREHQHTNGVIPSWYAPGTLLPAETFRDENAETAGAALFLARYARASGDTASRSAAIAALSYIFREIVPERKWYDFETFFSCSRKPVGYLDRYTDQHPQNTLSIHQTAEACLALYDLTGDRSYLQRGAAVLDYLGLYQQVWSPRWLSADLFGGFGVQNTDGEWSDARQGYFAETYMEYFAATGQREYFERGVAALRAMFSLFESPSSPRTAENYAHGGYDRVAGVTGLHWGTGSSVVSVHLITAAFGDAYCDATGAWGAGIDGCRVSEVRVHGDRITCVIRDAVQVHRTIRLVIGNMTHAAYRVTVNGRDLGRHERGALQKGIDIGL